jgi:arylsulfatase A-like enzyme
MTQPNILFIVLDDLNAWIGALGRHRDTRTPNIDALARRGALFAKAYCSAPYCNASRMGMFTGRSPSSLGVFANEPFWDSDHRPPTLMERLRELGYLTFGAGKVFHGVFDYERALFERLDHAPWKEIENREAVWDHFHTNSAEPLPSGRPLNGLFDFSAPDAVPDMYRHFDWGPIAAKDEEALPDERVTVAIETFLASPPQQPFFCAAGLYKPHLPWHAPQRFFDLIPHEPVLPLVKADDLDDAPPIAREWALTPPDHELVTSRGVWPDAVRAYLACIAYADHMVGRILRALDASPARDSTLIVLCGDNGFHLGEKLHWRKFALWEEATQVPLILAGPGIARASVAAPVSLIDIFPTLIEAAGGVAADTDGWSLLQSIAGVRRPLPVISTWGEGNHSIRAERWRFTRYSDGSEELFDHELDPHEWTNLAMGDQAWPEAKLPRALLTEALNSSLRSRV